MEMPGDMSTLRPDMPWTAVPAAVNRWQGS
jgi:hypothetical protein